MNIEHLRLFVRIASTANISLAGRELNISPAVASAHIGKLEETLGVRLIHRTTRKVSLTDDGKLFLPHAQEVLDSIETAQAAVGSGAQTPQGTLRVTAPASFGRMHLIPAIPEFLELYPKLNIDFQFSDSILDVVEGGFDVAIRDADLKTPIYMPKSLLMINALLWRQKTILKNTVNQKHQQISKITK